jgi:hypothetical protein
MNHYSEQDPRFVASRNPAIGEYLATVAEAEMKTGVVIRKLNSNPYESGRLQQADQSYLSGLAYRVE